MAWSSTFLRLFASYLLRPRHGDSFRSSALLEGFGSLRRQDNTSRVSNFVFMRRCGSDILADGYPDQGIGLGNLNSHPPESVICRIVGHFRGENPHEYFLFDRQFPAEVSTYRCFPRVRRRSEKRSVPSHLLSEIIFLADRIKSEVCRFLRSSTLQQSPGRYSRSSAGNWELGPNDDPHGGLSPLRLTDGECDVSVALPPRAPWQRRDSCGRLLRLQRLLLARRRISLVS